MISLASIPQPAASVIVVRQHRGHLEVYLTRRKSDLRFLGGYTVFPGGRVDAADHATAQRLQGLGRRPASKLFNMPAGLAMAHWVAAFRELHEEIGLWLGQGVEPPMNRWHEHVDAHCVLPVRRLSYIAHWITPRFSPIRFDTRFFVTVVEGDPSFRCHEQEIDEGWWMRPGDALQEANGGNVLAILPTLSILQSLAAFGSVSRMRAVWRGHGRRVAEGNEERQVL